VSFNWGISRVPAVRASQVLALTPLVGLTAAVILLSEVPSPGQLVGGALVLLGVAVLDRVVNPGSLATTAGPRDDPRHDTTADRPPAQLTQPCTTT
jgi:hypothetical protein